VAGRKRASGHVTIMDVARVSGFSASTVSIVLNEAPLSRYVAAKTKEHIRITAQTMGYRPDAFARSLRRRRSHTIGIMVFDISDPFCTLILRGIEKTLYPTAYLPIIMDAHNQKKQFDAYLEMLLAYRVEGLIVVANWLFAEYDLLVDVQKNKIPTVVVGLDLTPRQISSVLVDNDAGGYAALGHLHSLGHRKIAVIRGPAKLYDSIHRWNGVARFAQETALTLHPSLVSQLPDVGDPTSGFEGGRALTTRLIQGDSEFTALLAFDDLTALGAIRALHQAGLRVPEDCSVIGFDDVPTAAVSTPGVTTIRQPMEHMGSIAAEWILDAVVHQEQSEPKPCVIRLLPPELVLRESTLELRR
jgi:LacI family transcriptional regulator